MTRAWLLGVALALTACSSTPWRPVTDWMEGRRLVDRAEWFARRGDHVAARTLYERVIQHHPGRPAAARALFRLALIEATADSPIRDYRRAHERLDRLVREHPRSPHAGEARIWRDTLAQLLASEHEAARIKLELQRMNRVESERLRGAAQRRSDREWLRKQELELEEVKRP